MNKLVKEFKDFAVKGNMIEIAIGVIIGSAFSKVVDVLVKQVFLPPLSFLTDGNNWENRKLILRHASPEKIEEISIGYGKLLQVSVDFLIISITVFIVVKFMSRLKKRAHDVSDKSVTTPKDIELLDKVATLLEQQNRMLEENFKREK